MDWLLIGVIGVIVLALVFDFTNGFHDAANSVATVVATRALPARWAPWFSAVFNFSAFFVVGTAVANTVAKVVKHDSEGIAVVFAPSWRRSPGTISPGMSACRRRPATRSSVDWSAPGSLRAVLRPSTGVSSRPR